MPPVLPIRYALLRYGLLRSARLRHALLAAALALSAASPAAASPAAASPDTPFGVAMGTSALALLAHGCRPGPEPDRLSCDTLPGGQPGFAFYQVVAPLGVGLCEVMGGTTPVTGPNRGRRLIDLVERLRREVEAVYGPPLESRRDNQAVAARADDPALFAELKARTASYFYDWTPTGRDTAAVFVSAGALDEERGYVLVAYLMRNHGACDALDAGRNAAGKQP